MKILIIITLFLYPAIIFSQDVFYAPSKYMCTPQGETCVCTQHENSSFPESFKSGCCYGYNQTQTFQMRFIWVRFFYSQIPGYPSAAYQCENGLYTNIYAKLKAVVENSPNWKWDGSGPICQPSAGANDPYQCPLAARST